MKMQELFEARRNPDKNPKIDLLSVLERYADSPNIYIHFTNILKMGVNPLTKYTTPAGIYAYPLKEVWNLVIDDRLPFAKNRKFVYVIKPTKQVVELADYNNSDWNKDKQRLTRMFKNDFFSINTNTDVFADFIPVAINKHYQPDEFDFEFLSIEQLLEIAELTSKIKKPSSFFWNTTRIISMDGERIEEDIFKWNKLFRKLGYNIFSDKKGMGLIHKNEPTQSIFLDKKSIEVVEVLDNKRRPMFLQKQAD